MGLGNRLQYTNDHSKLLETLNPDTLQELSLLRNLLRCAEQLRGVSVVDLTLARPGMIVSDARLEGSELDARAMLSELPDAARRFFHGLVEALDIYQSIHGRALAVQSVSLRDPAVRELKQIRDMCLDEGLKSIY